MPMLITVQLQGVSQMVNGFKNGAGAAHQLTAATRQAQAAQTSLVRTMTAGQSALGKIPVGPHQRLINAQQNAYKALAHGGTPAQVADTQLAVQKARQAVQKAQAPTPIQQAVQASQGTPATRVKPFRMAGPYNKLIKAHEDLRLALMLGTEADIKDAQLAVHRAQARSEWMGRRKLTPLQQAVMSTRFNIGGQQAGMSPLMGRTLQAAFPKASGAQLTGAAVGITAVILAIVGAFKTGELAVKTFVEGIRVAASTLRELGAAKTISGGTTGNISALTSMGIPAGSIPGLAAGVRGAMTSNPFAGNVAAGMGVAPIPRPFGDPNEAGTLQKLIEGIAGTSSATERLTKARALEMDSILPLIEAIRRNRAAYDADKKAREGIMDPKTVQLAGDLGFSMMRVKEQFLNLVMAFGKPFLKDITAGFSTLANVLRGAAEWLNKNPEAVRNWIMGIAKPIGDFFQWWWNLSMGLRQIIEDFGGFPKGSTKAMQDAMAGVWADFQKNLDDLNKSQAKAIDDNTNAAKKNTDALLTLSEALYGGGTRARGSLPSNLTGVGLQRAIDSGALRLGYWTM